MRIMEEQLVSPASQATTPDHQAHLEDGKDEFIPAAIMTGTATPPSKHHSPSSSPRKRSGSHGKSAKLDHHRHEAAAAASNAAIANNSNASASNRGSPCSAEKCTSTHDSQENTPLHILMTTYLNYLLLVIVGHTRDFIARRLWPSEYSNLVEKDGYAPLNSDFESFFTRRLYSRVRDCWNRPITGVPGGKINVLERHSENNNISFKLTGKSQTVINFSSYNYLGFAQKEGPCTDAVIDCIEKYSVGVGSARSELGSMDIHREAEQLVARFVGKEDAMIFSMGFATNSTMISAIMGKGSLIISDELNHSSLVLGSRMSGATIKVYKHNCMESLEAVLRECIGQGQPRTHRPWKKILLVIEGLYSMEGTICNLPEIIRLRDRYKFYLFIDEAHSIGALGPRGRGVCDFWGISPSKVDILMGTFTKSFGAAGGYISGSKDLIQHFRSYGHGFIYCEPMSPPVCQQIITSLKIISGEIGNGEGARRLKAIQENSIYFMRQLRKLRFIVYGDEGSPIVPMLVFHPAKLAAFSREALDRGLAVVVVGYPATPIITSRVRFCISASHTRADLDQALAIISDIGDIMLMKSSTRDS